MSIRQHAQECALLFASSESLDLDSKPLIAELETQRSRFKVWAGNLGVFASERASADFRLQHNPTASGILINLLTQLANKLRLAPGTEFSELTQERDSEGSDSASSVASLIIEEEIDSESGSERTDDNAARSHKVLDDITEIISRLYHITTIIRRPGAGAKNERDRVLQYVRHCDPPMDLSELKFHIEWQLSRQCAGLQPISPLYNRLVEGALYRRQRLLYCQSHQDKLQRGIDDFFGAHQRQQPIIEDPKEVASRPNVAPIDIVASQRSDSNQGPAPTFLGTEATVPDKVSPSTYAKSAIISGITASAVGRRGELDLPPLPKMVGGGQTETQCPYCMHLIENELQGKRSTREHQWRRHLMKDLSPYVCLFDDCELTSPWFKSTEEWIDHMKWDHTKLYSCQVAGHEHIFFETATELGEHLVGEHQQAIPEYQRDELVKKGARPAPDVFASFSHQLNSGRHRASDDILLCPMCDFSLSGIDDCGDVDIHNLSAVRFSNDVYKEIRDHIASHMEKIALLSLPEREDVEAETCTNQISHPTWEERGEDELDTVSVTYEDPPIDTSDGDLENLPALSESWSDLLGDGKFGGKSDYDPDSDSLICHFKVIQAEQQLLRDSGFGMMVFHDPPEYHSLETIDVYGTVDVVAVHGLDGHITETWTHPTSQFLWLRDGLLDAPSWVRNARIMSFGYSPWTGRDLPGKIFTVAENLLKRVSDMRTEEGEKRRSLVFIGHSLGGTIIEAALSRASSVGSDFTNIFQSTTAIVFFATPQVSIKATWTMWVNKLIKHINPDREPLNEEESWSEELSAMMRCFREIAQDLDIVTFFETYYAPLFVGVRLARLDSAKESVADLNADHEGICRFESRNSPNGRQVWQRLERLSYGLRDQALRNGTDHEQELNTCLKTLNVLDVPRPVQNNSILVGATWEWISRHEMFQYWLEDKSGILFILGTLGNAGRALTEHIAENLPGRAAIFDTWSLTVEETLAHIIGALIKSTVSKYRSLADRIGLLEAFRRLQSEQLPGFKWPLEVLVRCLTPLLLISCEDPAYLILDGCQAARHRILQISDLLLQLVSLTNKFKVRILIIGSDEELRSYFPRYHHHISLDEVDNAGMYMFQWVLFAQRPLTAHELQVAVSINMPKEYARDSEAFMAQLHQASHGLLHIENDQVQLIDHSPTIAYLTRKTQTWLDHNNTEPGQRSPHSTIALTCLTYLNMQPPSVHLSKDYFLTYAARYWSYHLNEAPDGLDDLLQELAHHQNVSLYCRRARSDRDLPISPYSEDPKLLHIVSELGHEKVIAKLLKISDDVNAEDDWGRTPLLLATMKGHKLAVKLLLEQENIDSDAEDFDGYTPIARAAEYGFDNICSLLLAKCVDVDKTTHGVKPLYIAAQNSQRGVVAQLSKVTRGGPETGRDSTFLHQAVRRGNISAVKLLLEEMPGDRDIKDKAGRTPLHIAAVNQNYEITKLLLQAGANVAASTDSGKTVLDIAESNGDLDVMSRLIASVGTTEGNNDD